LEALNDVYNSAGKKIIIDEAMKSILPLLNVEQLQK